MTLASGFLVVWVAWVVWVVWVVWVAWVVWVVWGLLVLLYSPIYLNLANLGSQYKSGVVWGSLVHLQYY